MHRAMPMPRFAATSYGLRSLARLIPGLGVDAVSVVPLLLELLARGRHFALMFGGSLLQPGGFGSLDLGLGLRGACLGGCFFGKGLTAFEFGCFQPGLFANLLGLPLPAPSPRSPAHDGQGSNRQNCCYCGDHNPNSAGTQIRLR